MSSSLSSDYTIVRTTDARANRNRVTHISLMGLPQSYLLCEATVSKELYQVHWDVYLRYEHSMWRGIKSVVPYQLSMDLDWLTLVSECVLNSAAWNILDAVLTNRISTTGLKNQELIDLSSNKLSGTIPDELGQLVSSPLSELVLSKNQLSGTVPDGLCTIPHHTTGCHRRFKCALSFDCSDKLCGCDCSCNPLFD